MSLIIASFLAASLLVSPVLAAPNLQINYQGKLADSSGVTVSDGNYNMEFKLYTASSGGTALWTETRTGLNRVTVTSGLFSILLGSVTSLSAVNFNQTLYLGVNIGGTGDTASWDGEMTPRKILGAAPAAFEADKLDGLESAQFLRSDAANATTTSSTFVTFNQSGTGNILDLQDSGTTIFTVLDGGNVGIGTTTSYARLTTWSDGSSPLFNAVNTSSTTLFTILNSGNVGIATTSPASTFTVVGSACVSGGTGASAACSTTAGTISARVFNTANVDVAEEYLTVDLTLMPAELVALDRERPQYVKRAASGDVIIGIVSAKPGVLLGGAAPRLGAETSVPVALAGRVPLRTNLEGGPIAVGDRLAVSSSTGVAKKAAVSDSTVGWALEPLTALPPGETEGRITVFVNLQTTSLSPEIHGDKITSFFSWDETSGHLKVLAPLVVKEVQAEKLCLGSVCIGEGELRLIRDRLGLTPPLQNVSVSGSVAPPVPDPASPKVSSTATSQQTK